MTAPDARRPDPSEAPPYFAGYLATVPDGPLLDTLHGTGEALAAWIARRTAAQLAGRPAPGKWTVGEALQHVLDTERVFTFRLLWIARGAPDPLPGFDQDAWVPTSGAERRSAADLAEEFKAVRAATRALVATLPPEAWDRRGRAGGGEVTVRALAWMTAGHALHHLHLFRARWGD
jgi:uncharacterized damage-inducible protein DinB